MNNSKKPCFNADNTSLRPQHLFVTGIVLLLVASFSSVTDAALLSRLDGEAAYDSDRSLTWVANGNLAATNTFGLATNTFLGSHALDSYNVNGFIMDDGRMNWSGALHWIDAMNSSSYLGQNDWRLATTISPDPTCPSSIAIGFNCSGSELGHLFYNELGGVAGTSILTSTDSNLSLFPDIQSDFYWSGTQFGTSTSSAWAFSFFDGFQAASARFNNAYVLAVRTGDVSAVPIPSALWLFGSGLVGLIGIKRRKNT